MNIVQVSDDDVTGWKRYIKFNYNDVDYSVTLYWNENEGYDVTFTLSNILLSRPLLNRNHPLVTKPNLLLYRHARQAYSYNFS